MKQSFSEKKPVLLQEEEENAAEETNDDADVNAEAKKSMITRRTWLLNRRGEEDIGISINNECRH